MKKTMLVSIANYGDKALKHLNTVVDEFLSYQKYDVTISVHSTVPLGRDDVTVTMYDPDKVGRMAYLHRQEFVENKNKYDLYLYNENDMHIKEDAVDMYVKYSELLPENYCLGFLPYEIHTDDENLYLFNLWPNVYHEPIPYNTGDGMQGTSYLTDKELCISGVWYFTVTNANQSCYLVTKNQLAIAISRPEYTKTDTHGLETATCGIFTNWRHSDGVLHKVYTRNVEDLKKCLIHHLADKHGTDTNSRNAVATWKLLVSDLNLK